MSYVVEVLRQEHRNIESLLGVLERELSLFDRGDHPNYEVVLAPAKALGLDVPPVTGPSGSRPLLPA